MAQITFNGRTYDAVTLDDLTMDELLVLWDYAQLSVDQIPDLEGFHPGVTMALIHIAVARGEPDETAKTIGRAIRQMKWVELQTVFEKISEEVEELPPPSEPEPSSPSSGSGETSEPTGEPAQEPTPQNGSGNPGSATGPASVPRISVG